MLGAHDRVPEGDGRGRGGGPGEGGVRLHRYEEDSDVLPPAQRQGGAEVAQDALPQRLHPAEVRPEEGAAGIPKPVCVCVCVHAVVFVFVFCVQSSICAFETGY